jgi:hypothetical protein
MNPISADVVERTWQRMAKESSVQMIESFADMSETRSMEGVGTM